MHIHFPYLVLYGELSVRLCSADSYFCLAYSSPTFFNCDEIFWPDNISIFLEIIWEKNIYSSNLELLKPKKVFKKPFGLNVENLFSRQHNPWREPLICKIFSTIDELWNSPSTLLQYASQSQLCHGDFFYKVTPQFFVSIFCVSLLHFYDLIFLCGKNFDDGWK